MNAPRVSVVVAARNEAKHLPACLRSIRRQRNVSFECIVVNDGSVDETGAIGEAWAKKDTRFRVVHRAESHGLAAARNLGLAEAAGSFVTFVDGDDFLFPGSLAARAGRLESSPENTVGCYGDWVSVPEWTPLVPVRRRAATRPDVWMPIADRAVPFIASAPLLRSDLVAAIGGFDESLATAEDADFWQWWLRLSGITVYEPILSIAYRRRAGSMTRRDLVGHFIANGRAFESFDTAFDGAPEGVLHRPDAQYRADLSKLPRAGLAAVMAVVAGRTDELAFVLEELDPTALRLAGPSQVADDAIALAKRRVRGTKGGRVIVRQIAASRSPLREAIEQAAAAPATGEELLDAAKWLGEFRREMGSHSRVK